MEQQTPEGLSARVIEAATSEPVNDRALPDILGSLEALETDQCSDILEPLVLVPILAPIVTISDAAKPFLLLISRVGNAKESVLALSEELERIRGKLENAEDSNGDEDPESIHLKAIEQAVVLLQCFALATPRVALRKQTFTITIEPWVHLIEEINNSAASSGSITRTTANHLLDASVDIVSALLDRAKELPLTEEDRRSATRSLHRLLAQSVCHLYPSLNPSLALRLYEAQNPRLILRSGVEPGWESDDAVLRKAASLIDDVPLPKPDALNDCSPLVLLVHRDSSSITEKTLDAYTPMLVAYLQANHALDACLAFLLRFLSSSSTSSELAESTSATFIPLLAHLSAAHPHPPTRLVLFRGILTPMLQRTPTPLRLALLADLIDGNGGAPPQLRAAAVGLARAEVVRAPSALALRILGPRIFRPFDLAKVQGRLREFVEGPEPAWYTEVLLFYFAVLSADAENKTGLRDKDSLRSVERDLLKPLRDSLPGWIAALQPEDSEDGHGHGHGHGHAVMALAGLETALERVDEVRERINA